MFLPGIRKEELNIQQVAHVIHFVYMGHHRAIELPEKFEKLSGEIEAPDSLNYPTYSISGSVSDKGMLDAIYTGSNKKQEKVEKKKQTEFSEKIDELNQETDTLLEEIDKWQT